MSSTQLLDSLLLLLPLRCRRNCNKLISLALLLLSALFAYNEHRQQRQRQTTAEEAAGDSSSSNRRSSSNKQNNNSTAAATTIVTLDTPLYTAVATATVAVVKRHPNRSNRSSSNRSQDVGTVRGTGTGAAYISWHSSHCHRSPGAQSEAEEAELQTQQLLHSTKTTTTNKTRLALILLTPLHTLKSSISPPSTDATFVRLTTTTATAATTSSRTTKLLASSCIEEEEAAATTTAVESTTNRCCRNPQLSVVGNCYCIASIAT
ncbi:hypothetical protein ACLKA6_006905 [Drosophila palustris]